MTGVVAGVLIETVPGAAPRVAARLLRTPGVTLHGGDGSQRLAAVLDAASGEALEALSERLLAADAEILGVYPTFVGADEEDG
jgi:nitrate reductase NapAB chaperone NapD